MDDKKYLNITAEELERRVNLVPDMNSQIASFAQQLDEHKAENTQKLSEVDADILDLQTNKAGKDEVNSLQADLITQTARIDNLVSTSSGSFYEKTTDGTTGALLVVDSGATTGQINLASVTPVAVGYTPVAGDYVRLVYGVASGSSELIDTRIGADGIVYASAGDAVRGQINAVKKDAKQVTFEKMSGYYNLANLPTSVIYKNKRLFGYNPTTYEPLMYDEEGYITVVVPISSLYGKVHVPVNPETPPNNYAIGLRYKTGVSATQFTYNQAFVTGAMGWDISYDAVNHIFTYNTDLILSSASTDMMMFCFYNADPLVYPENDQTLDIGVPQLKDFIGEEQLTANAREKLTSAYEASQPVGELVLPRYIPIVSGLQLNIYYENILYNKMLRHAFVIRQQDELAGNYYEDVWQYTPNVSALTSNGTNMRLYERNLTDYVVKSTILKMVPPTHGAGTYKCIVIGDSKIDAGVIMSKLVELFTADGNTNVAFLGTRGTAPALHEGRSGWSSKTFCTSQTYNGSTNAFWNPSTSKFDFAYYMSNNGYTGVDCVCINLGTNDVSALGFDYAAIIAYYDEMIASIHAYDPTIKILIGLTENTCQQKFSYSQNKNKILGFVKALIAKYDNATYFDQKIYLIPIYLNQNLYADYNYTETAESARNTTLVKRVSDHVHQSNFGYYKNADMIYSSIKYYLGL